IQYQLGSGSFQSSGSFTGLTAGSYTITAKDGNGCTRSTIISVDNTSAPVLSISNTDVSCFGKNDGSITLSASGGTGARLFSINGGSSFQSSGNFSNLTAGIYQVQVKDAAGCTDAGVVTIKTPNQIRFSTAVVAARCYAGSDGEIHLSEVSGGIGKPSFSINGSTYQSSPDFTGLRAGTYTVYLKDIASCIVTGSAVIGRPSDIVTTVTITNASCNGSNNGVILASATGGTPGYYYSLSGGSWQSSGRFETGAGSYQVMVMDNNGCRDTASATVGQPSIISATSNTTNSTCGNNNGSMLVAGSGGSGSGYQYSLNGTTWNSTGIFNNLSAGTYYVIVKDGAGCQIIHDVTVKDANGPSITGISKTNVTCNGGTDGSITVNSTSGGSGTLMFSIDGSNWYNSGKFTGLTAGTYTVSVKDANGCIGNSAPQVLSQPNAIAVSVRTTNVTCNGTNNGQVSVSAIGGSGTLGYSIDGGQTFQSDRNFSGLRAGYYLVMVRDAGGCVGYATFSIEEPAAINIVTGVLDVTCNGASNGAVSIQASGGNAPYTYSLNGSSYQSSGVFTGMHGGTYTAYVKDVNNCVRTKNFVVNEPDELFVFSYVSDVSCAGGNNGVIDLSVTGGVLPYTFKWSNEAASEDVFNLRAGTYSVMVSDANGCIKTRTFTITAPMNPIVVNGVVTGTNNTSGAIDITVTGGVPPYTYTWSNGRKSEDLSGLAPGVYSVVIRDANNCEAYSEFTVSNTSGTVESALSGHFRMHPNPAGNEVSLHSAANMESLRVYNAQGVEVFRKDTAGEHLNIPTAQWPAGTYLVHVLGDGQRAVHKLVILH
ncbi:MAG: T9SS type A sorting domain-containing protein, partial [Bacteroidetes bacterium]|nr:T9SS type A sorting domain-containing protein [Bacteroidota bacterium]